MHYSILEMKDHKGKTFGWMLWCDGKSSLLPPYTILMEAYPNGYAEWTD